MLADTSLNLIAAKAAQRLGDGLCCALLLHRQFRVAVHVLEPLPHRFRVKLLGDSIHITSPDLFEPTRLAGAGSTRTTDLPFGTVTRMETTAAATITRFASKAKNAASREARFSWLPVKVMTPSIHSTPSGFPAIAV